ncbi:MAG: lysylphosphatidylglycerol synthase domain-containing protein, partial [Candidatus Binatia bacterium]
MPLRFVVSILLTAGLCFYLLRQVDVAELADWLRRVDRGLFAGYAAVSLAGLVARAARYRMLIGPRAGFFALVLVTATRNFLVDLLPARVGSLSYVYLLTRRFDVPLEPVLGREVGRLFAELHRDNGVEFHAGAGVEAFEGSTRVERV